MVFLYFNELIVSPFIFWKHDEVYEFIYLLLPFGDGSLRQPAPCINKKFVQKSV